MNLDFCPFSTDEYPSPEPKDLKEEIARIGTSLSVCRLTKKECRYGLTNIVVPDHCPLRAAPLRLEIAAHPAGSR